MTARKADRNPPGVEIDTFEDLDTGPHQVTPAMQMIAVVSQLSRAVTQLEETNRRLDRLEQDNKSTQDEVRAAAAKLTECPLHTKALETLVSDVGELRKQRSPSNEMRALEVRDQYTANRVKRWLPIIGALMALFGAGAGGGTLAQGCSRQDNSAALIKAFREEQRETRESLKKELRTATSRPDYPK